MTPLVTVGIPSYNHAPYLPAAIESVLRQTLSDVELVIADDGSSDGSLAIAERYAAAHPERVTVVTHPGHANLGLGSTANLYRSHARGRYVVGLGSDDALYPDTLEREVEFLEAHPEVSFVYGLAHRVDKSGQRLPGARTFGADVTAGGRTTERLVQGNKIPSMTVMIRRECFDAAGPEHATLVYGDWEFYARLGAHHTGAFIPRALAMHRVHGGNTSIRVSRETNLERAQEVTAVLRERAPAVGGQLAEPRVRALLELQTAFLGFVARDEPDAELMDAAFSRDPSLAVDGRWLSAWVWERLLDEMLLPDEGPFFVPWVAAAVMPHLEQGARAHFRREAAAAGAAERALRLARTGRPGRIRAVLPALARAPRRIADRRVLALLLDNVARGVPLRGYLRTKRLLVRHR